MSFLVVDNVLLACSYGTCQTRLKVTPLSLPSGSLALDLSVPDVTLGMTASLSRPHGVVKKFDAMGNLANQSVYVNGVLEGESLAYNAAGQVTQRLMFAGGKIHGSASMYTDGVLTAAMSFKEGLMDGASKFYNLQGKLALQTNFAANLEDGLRVTFDVDTGATLSEELFVKGILKGAGEAVLEAEGALEAGFAVESEVGLPELALDLDIDLNIDALAAVDGQSIATIMDHVSGVNIRPFCLCRSRANPAVAAATKKAHGVLKPQPCTPKTTSPWVPGSHVITLQDYPALTHSSKLICAYAGVIHVKDAGQSKATVP